MKSLNTIKLAQDLSVRYVQFAATGSIFCAGADIGWMQRQSANSEQANIDDARRFAELMRQIHEFPAPVIASVQGHAFGGGVGIIAAADIAIAAAEAEFSVSETKFGLLPAVIGPYLIKVVGARHAFRLAATAVRFSANEALSLGLLHSVVPREQLSSATDAVINSLLSNAPGAIRSTKGLYREILGGPIGSDVRELTSRAIATAEQPMRRARDLLHFKLNARRSGIGNDEDRWRIIG